MKKIVIFFMVLGILIQACEKELGRVVRPEDQPEISVDVTEPGTGNDSTAASDSLEGLSEVEKNDHSIYTFGGVRGLYFGCISSFRGEKDINFEITLGTSLTPNTTISQKEFEQLIRTGERVFGSLGAFSSYPVMDSGLVEISFIDKHDRKWCSTEITEKNSDRGQEIYVRVDQKRAKFIIESIHKVEIASETEGYRIKGYFDCMLYEVNGKGKKKIKGKFSGIVAPK